MSDSRHELWDDFASGQVLPELAVAPTRMQLFMFSAATWNRHHVHYSKDAAIAEGLPDVVVHRALLGNFLARMLDGWLAGRGEIRELNWKVQLSALPEQTLRVRGTVRERYQEGGRRFMRCDLQIVNERDEVVTAGNARIECFEGGKS